MSYAHAGDLLDCLPETAVIYGTYHGPGGRFREHDKERHYEG
jgi:hypothetical protein